MAIKFQYNKTSLQQLEKQLKIRVRTLPIIKNKESALRMEVKRCKSEAVLLEERLEKQILAYEAMFALWNEFDASLIRVNDVHLGLKRLPVYGFHCSKRRF
jgi:V/A-type H+-transporting ATPase subunit D